MVDDEKSTHPSLRPPPLHGGGDGSSINSSWVLVDMYPYIADRANSTTAHAAMRGGETLRVTLCAAPPPLASYLCVWCPGLPPPSSSSSGIQRATIETAESDLLLLRVSLRSGHPHGEFFVYKATTAGGKGGPLLRPLHDVPLACLNWRHNIGLLAHSDDHYFVAPLWFETCTDESTTFNLSVYNSAADDKWVTSSFTLHGKPPPCQLTAKVIVLGRGGQLAFVDPWRGIVICDVLGCTPPSYLLVPNQIIRYGRLPDEPQLCRDVVLIGSRLILADLCYLIEPGTIDKSCSTWEVSAWSKRVFSDEEWRQDYEVQSRDILIDGDSENVGLLPRMEDGEGVLRPTLEGLYIAHPLLSLTEGHVVHIMAKVGRDDDAKALMLRVDMKKKRLQAVAMFDGERMYGTFSYALTQSRIPQYLKLGEL
ncbi:unnamed protein product [Urochloa humidicola]